VSEILSLLSVEQQSPSPADEKQTVCATKKTTRKAEEMLPVKTE
jgi:hypothetical protein